MADNPGDISLINDIEASQLNVLPIHDQIIGDVVSPSIDDPSHEEGHGAIDQNPIPQVDTTNNNIVVDSEIDAEVGSEANDNASVGDTETGEDEVAVYEYTKNPVVEDEMEEGEEEDGPENIIIIKLMSATDPSSNKALLLQLLKSSNLKAVIRGYTEYTKKNKYDLDAILQFIALLKRSQNLDLLEEVFKSSLVDLPSIKLYSAYLDYILSIESKEVVLQTFEYTTTQVGYSKDAGVIWAKYIDYVKNSQTSSSYEEQQKMDLLRKIYHKAIQIPISNIEDIWRDYDQFEHSLSKLTAKKFIGDQAGGYMTARGCWKDLCSLVKDIETIDWVTKPPTWTDGETEMLKLWKKYIHWEISNPLGLEKVPNIARVSFAYRSSILKLAYYPEIYYDYATFLGSNERPDEAILVLEQGLKNIPSSLLITFTLAEHLESKKSDFALISKLFDELIERLDNESVELDQRFDKERQDLLEHLQSTMTLKDIVDEDQGERRERERELQKQYEKEIATRVDSIKNQAITKLKSKVTLVWIIYMRVTRRSQSLRAARLIFSRARKSTLITSHVFTASALMEFYVNKDPIVAGKIFEVGLKTFPISDDPLGATFVLSYIEFLISLNDDNNTRALFERALSNLPVAHQSKVWNRYLEYETLYGDLSNLERISKRVSWGVDQRWNFLDLQIDELGPRISEAVVVVNAPRVLPKVGIRPDTARWRMYKPEGGMAKYHDAIVFDASSNAITAILPHSILVPEALARFASMLPKKESYDGPYLNVDEIVRVVCEARLGDVMIGRTVPLPPGLSGFDLGRKRTRNDY